MKWLVACWLAVCGAGPIGLALADSADEMKASAAASEISFEATSHYATHSVSGWTVLVNPRVAKDPVLLGHVLDELRTQFDQVVHALPSPAVTKLRTVKIWIDVNDIEGHVVGYQSREPLNDARINPDKQGGVEIADLQRFLAYAGDLRSVLVHEFAHAWHEQFVEGGLSNPAIQAAYDNAMRNGLCDSVLTEDNGVRKAYAATNVREYFAASSAAFFGRNDEYPFVRAELRQHDPLMYSLLQKVWGGEANGVAIVRSAAGAKLNLTVTNASDVPALIFWLSDTGEHLDREVRPHQSAGIVTFSGHRWGAWFSASDRKQEFTMPGHDAEWVIGKAAD